MLQLIILFKVSFSGYLYLFSIFLLDSSCLVTNPSLGKNMKIVGIFIGILILQINNQIQHLYDVKSFKDYFFEILKTSFVTFKNAQKFSSCRTFTCLFKVYSQVLSNSCQIIYVFLSLNVSSLFLYIHIFKNYHVAKLIFHFGVQFYELKYLYRSCHHHHHSWGTEQLVTSPQKIPSFYYFMSAPHLNLWQPLVCSPSLQLCLFESVL